MKGNLQCLDRSKILILPVYPSTIIPKRSIPLAFPYFSPFEQINKTSLLGLEQKKKRVVETTNTLSHLFAFSLSLSLSKILVVPVEIAYVLNGLLDRPGRYAK